MGEVDIEITGRLSDDPKVLLQSARLYRALVMRQMWEDGTLTRQDALELLNAELTPGDPTTLVDDREMLDLNKNEISNRLLFEHKSPAEIHEEETEA